jgi:hypothetical protein
MNIKLTSIDKQFITDNHTKVSVADMAKHLHRATTTVYDYMEENGLSVFRSKPWGRGSRQFKATGPGYFKWEKKDYLV